jgi:hypothetical protein
MPRFALAALLLSLFSAAANAAPEPDRNLQKLLDKAKIKYQIDDQGDFKITYDLGNGRTQLAYVRSASNDFGTLKIREVLSIGYASAGENIPNDVANRLLEHNAQTKLGAWTKQGRLAVFVSKIPADAGPRELADAVELTAVLADALESELMPGKDDY